jgi:hypothetical protein
MPLLEMGPFGYPADYILWWVLFLSLLLHTWSFFKFFPRRRWRWLGLILGNGLVFACFGGCAALGAETYLRFVSVETDAFGLSLPARRWFALHVKLNSLGCRDSEWTVEKPAEVRRIAFVGDSYTYGWGIENVADRFTERIQALFDRRRPGAVQIMNVAKPGWDTGDQIRPVKDMIEVYGADEIVLCYVFNDVEKALPRNEAFDPTRPPLPRFFNLDTSCLLDRLYWSLYVPRLPTVRGYHDWIAEGYRTPSLWKAHEKELGQVIEVCRSSQVPLRVVLLPFVRRPKGKFDAQAIHALVRSFFRDNGVEVLDLGDVLRDRPAESLVVSPRDPHPNMAAHAVFAEAIWRSFYAPPDS